MSHAPGNAVHFPALDGLRGLAAILIIHRHAPEFFGIEIGSTHLAVDMFFCLSGFVMAHAYEDRLRSGAMRFREFLLVRLLRLWPLYALAVTFMAAGAVFLGRDPAVVFRHTALTIFFLPTPTIISGSPAFFPMMFLAWSLFWEACISVVYGLAARKLTMPALLTILVLAFCALAATATHFQTLNAGFYWQSAWAGGCRIAFSFMAGVLTYRLRPEAGRWRKSAWPCMALLCVVLLAPVAHNWRAETDLSIVVLVLPAIIWIASSSTPSTKSAKAFLTLGAISYPLYLFHVPVFRAAVAVLKPVIGHPAVIAGIALTIALLILSLMLDTWVDRPLRRALKNRIVRPDYSVITSRRASAL